MSSSGKMYRRGTAHCNVRRVSAIKIRHAGVLKYAGASGDIDFFQALKAQGRAMDKKECNACHEVKELIEFPAQPSKCKECIASQRRATVERKVLDGSYGKKDDLAARLEVQLARIEAKLDRLLGSDDTWIELDKLKLED